MPRDRGTSLLRLMGAGASLMRAIEDLTALPADAHERALAEKARNEGIEQGIERGIERGLKRGLSQGIERGLSQGIAPLVRMASRKLGRALTDDERRTLTTRLDTLGPDRLGDAVLDLSADEFARWIADAAAR